MDIQQLVKLSNQIRYDILEITTEAGSGHPSSSLSSVELMVGLFFSGVFKANLDNPRDIRNDKIIFSKGHAAPLLYSLYYNAGKIRNDEFHSLRKFDGILEGHPTKLFKYVDVPTGSLGQGLSIGLGMCLGQKLLKQKNEDIPNVYILLGDSEITEGQIWEAANIASHYKACNLVGILDVNGLGQSGETIDKKNLHIYERKFQAFGWETYIIKDGHNLDDIVKTFRTIESRIKKDRNRDNPKPKVIIANTIKGKGVKFMENKNGYHGKALTKEEFIEVAQQYKQSIEKRLIGHIELPKNNLTTKYFKEFDHTKSTKLFTDKLFHYSSSISTREAYGQAITEAALHNKKIVVFDAETSNSTFSNIFKKYFPNRFFEMYIAEQNMISVALGIASVGFIPICASFAAFLSRSYDQVRMASYADLPIILVGSHCGVSIGQDGSSQMALEDIASMSAIRNSQVFYPSDGLSTRHVIMKALNNRSISYIRLTRSEANPIYTTKEYLYQNSFGIIQFQHLPPSATVICAGITTHESIKSITELAKEKIGVKIIDLYEITSFNKQLLIDQLVSEKNILPIVVVEDHYEHGGISSHVLELLSKYCTKKRLPFYIHLCVKKEPKSGSMQDLLNYMRIDSNAITQSIKKIIK